MKNKSFILLIILCCSCLKEEAIPVIVDFKYEVINDDYSTPVDVILFNRTEGADQYEWRFEGANFSRSVDRNPGVIRFDTKGTYAITLTALNVDGSEDAKTLEIKIDDPVVVDFTATNIVDTFSPATFSINNLTTGASSYKWIFEGGIPATSAARNPEKVIFSDPGEHTISLEVSNGRETYTKSTTVFVAPLLRSNFDYTIAFEDDDYQIPAKVNFRNTSISATDYQWIIEGANISTSKNKDIEVVFNATGEKKITLRASNGKQTKTITQSITFFKNTNIRVFKDVKLGINTAHKNNSIGSFFSISSRKAYTAQQLTSDIEKTIDLVFYGLNSTYERSQFLSPSQLSSSPFNDISNPKNTIFVNTQELCSCTDILTTSQFDRIFDDTWFNTLTISSSDNLFFDDTRVPRIVLFKTEAGKKGAIKIKEFIKDGDNSYILVDIKVQKEKR